MKTHNCNGWTYACVLYLVGCALVDLFPYFTAPHFRYTGSDPAIHVWNLGWPLALVIYDSQSGLHIGPLAVPILGLQLILFGVAVAVYLIRKNRRIAS